MVRVMASSVAGWTALVLYLVAEIVSIFHLRSESRTLGIAAGLLLGAGLAVHFVALEIRAHAIHSVPYRDLPDSMSLFAWMLAAAYGILFLRHREGSTGPFLIPLVILFLAVSLFSRGSERVPNPDLTGSLFAFHVTVAILGYAALTLSFVLALLYLIQARQIQQRRMGLLFSRLPALDVLTRLQNTTIAVGVAALTVATVLGLIWANRTWGTIWDVKVLSTVVTIGAYVAALLSANLGWRGRRSAILSIAAFGILIFSYTIVNLFLSQEHLFR
jgi:ABC-type transport system involved in cytochrome c biogenesis permease subunit